MPTYVHECTDENCKHVWEDFYSIVEDPPKTCPKCQKNTAKRLISGGSGRGIVELTGHDLTEKIKKDARQIVKKAHTNENLVANFVGEDRYSKLVE